MTVIKMQEEVVESLDAHQLELQGMIGMGKFVDHFRDRVLLWQQRLGTIQEVIKLWESVSKNWASLESIFLASADIRSQLPDDTKVCYRRCVHARSKLCSCTFSRTYTSIHTRLRQCIHPALRGHRF